ncbi:hypothetical protein [Paracidovorax avenae]|uniref:hypothetical protein n=1 Tax=Paracidovorax avenae TaxID=80867 RepID=UPI0006B3BA5D|nr:hypothetical protein [Paracidovorax avenae]
MPTVTAKCEGTTYEAEYEFLDENTIAVALPDGTTSMPITVNTANPYLLAQTELRAYGLRVSRQARK